ncbi:unnamed protein product, partial [Schistocephalus solidus]|uniref:PhoLip_ATPase_C domain-containing protein n=1 Tax=Schistocephalus solidus TaxID=70667 RepID=A0A183TKA7_SCHSO
LIFIVLPPYAFSSPQDSHWHWQSVDDAKIIKAEPFNAQEAAKLAKENEFCLTGDGIEELRRSGTEGLKFLLCILPKTKVLSRVAPDQKEYILATLRNLGFTTLMCGDGTNDVGALKQAHIGVALLNQQPNQQPTTATKPVTSKNSFAKGLQDNAAEDEAPIVHLGDASIAAPFTAKMSSAIGGVTNCPPPPPLPHIHFSSRSPLSFFPKTSHSTESCRSCIPKKTLKAIRGPNTVCHIIRQGRCTLVTTLQMFKILAINALISAYSLSVLFLKGFKISDSQATIQALLMTGCFLFISRSKPLDKLSEKRPLPNVFNLYTLLTVGGQFAIHLTALYNLILAAEALMPPMPDGELIDIHGDFKPTVLNTVVYLIATALQVRLFLSLTIEIAFFVFEAP